ncbi:hypothetical protein GCM10012275_18020 [Longimycelium tulufanense]|uniref:Uncharacterized protein n=1 Tax=Longimycelium tulufanense TaxID=907463 RepID=A0A8J3C7A5_9PSEU|nr:hypothetical protein GCM10012275_18020 [Longimycelium tulufanense]
MLRKGFGAASVGPEQGAGTVTARRADVPCCDWLDQMLGGDQREVGAVGEGIDPRPAVSRTRRSGLMPVPLAAQACCGCVQEKLCGSQRGQTSTETDQPSSWAGSTTSTGLRISCRYRHSP